MLADTFSGGVITIEHALMLGFGAAGAYYLDRCIRRLDRHINGRLDQAEERLDALEEKEEHD